MYERLEMWYASQPPGSKTPPPSLGNPAKPIFGFFSILFLIGLVFRGVNWIFERLPFWMKEFAPYLKTTPTKTLISLSILILGIGFFFLRERFKLIYASIEIAAAGATAFFNISQLVDKPVQAILAIMGSLYITVRALDNFSKWYEKFRPARKRPVFSADI